MSAADAAADRLRRMAEDWRYRARDQHEAHRFDLRADADAVDAVLDDRERLQRDFAREAEAWADGARRDAATIATLEKELTQCAVRDVGRLNDLHAARDEAARLRRALKQAVMAAQNETFPDPDEVAIWERLASAAPQERPE